MRAIPRRTKRVLTYLCTEISLLNWIRIVWFATIIWFEFGLFQYSLAFCSWGDKQLAQVCFNTSYSDLDDAHRSSAGRRATYTCLGDLRPPSSRCFSPQRSHIIATTALALSCSFAKELEIRRAAKTRRSGFSGRPISFRAEDQRRWRVSP